MGQLNNCRACLHCRPADQFVSCMKPDPNMRGNSNAIHRGWFRYPDRFEPRWMMKKCDHFEERL